MDAYEFLSGWDEVVSEVRRDSVRTQRFELEAYAESLQGRNLSIGEQSSVDLQHTWARIVRYRHEYGLTEGEGW
jgi:hypothetical protein